MTDAERDVPSLSELLAGSPSNWGRWGSDDEIGSLNLLGRTEVLAAVQSVRSGKVFTLQIPIGHEKGDPVWPGRRPFERYMVVDEARWIDEDAPEPPGGLHWADDMLSGYLQGSSQYDALGHVWYDGKIYNGYDARSTIGGLRHASVAAIAERGVVGRGVLIDMARFRGKPWLEPGETFDHEDLLAAAQRQGVQLRQRDILLIRTGWLDYWYSVDERTFYDDFTEPGLRYSPELVEWFHAQEIPNLVTDTMGNEVTRDPGTGVELPLHNALMRNLGVLFAECCRLTPLAEDCAEDGQWDFLYTAAPLNVRRAAGAPVNPVVVK